MNEIIKYHNDLNTVIMRKWTTEEMNFFFSIIAKMKNRGTDEVTFDTDELKDLVKFDPKNYGRWSKTMESVADKITDLKYRERTSSSYVIMPLFQYFKVDLSSKSVTVQVTSRFEYILNQLHWQFTYYKLEDFIEIRSTYAKTMFRLLKQWKTIGRLELSVKELRQTLDIPKSYNISSIDRAVIKPIKSELLFYFNNLKIKKVKSNKRGNPVIAYEFTWVPEKTSEWDPYKYNYRNGKRLGVEPAWLEKEKQDSSINKEKRNINIENQDKETQKAIDEFHKKLKEYKDR